MKKDEERATQKHKSIEMKEDHNKQKADKYPTEEIRVSGL